LEVLTFAIARATTEVFEETTAATADARTTADVMDAGGSGTEDATDLPTTL
jgi:hypothetical protein